MIKILVYHLGVAGDIDHLADWKGFQKSWLLWQLGQLLLFLLLRLGGLVGSLDGVRCLVLVGLVRLEAGFFAARGDFYCAFSKD